MIRAWQVFPIVEPQAIDLVGHFVRIRQL